MVNEDYQHFQSIVHYNSVGVAMIEELRNEIDQLDRELLELLRKRFQLVEKVGEEKRKNTIPYIDPTRWNIVMESALQYGTELGLEQNFVKELFNAIHDYALRVQDR